MKADIGALKLKSTAYLTGKLKEETDDLLKVTRDATTQAQLEDCKGEVLRITKLLTKEDVQTLVEYVRKFNLTCTSIGKQTAGADKAKKEKVKKTPSPLYTIVDANFDDDNTNITESIFEAKGGLRASISKVDTQDLFEKLLVQPVLKKALGKIHEAVKKGTSACVQAIDGGAQILKRFDELVQASLGTEIRTKASLPKSDWARQIFQFEVFGCDECDANVGWPSFGLMQCNLVLSGTVSYIGLRSERVPGATYEEKRANVLRMTVDDIKKLVADGGWHVKFVDSNTKSGHSAVIFPTGFMVITVGSNARVLRWSLVADQADNNRAKITIGHMMSSYAEYKASPVYVAFAQLLGISV